jgi:hypothetical protein
MVFELFNNYANVEHFNNQMEEEAENQQMDNVAEPSVSCAEISERLGDAVSLFDQCSAPVNNVVEEPAVEEPIVEDETPVEQEVLAEQGNNAVEETTEEVLEGFQNNVYDEDEEFTNRLTNKYLSVDLLLRSLLYACLFYLLAHPDTFNLVIRRLVKVSKVQGLYISMAVFFVTYYVLNLFI